MAFKMAGYSPFDKEHTDKPDVGEGPKKIRITAGDYKAGDMVAEEHFENSPSFGDGNFPDLSVQDYSNIKIDDEGAYVTKLNR